MAQVLCHIRISFVASIDPRFIQDFSTILSSCRLDKFRISSFEQVGATEKSHTGWRYDSPHSTPRNYVDAAYIAFRYQQFACCDDFQYGMVCLDHFIVLFRGVKRERACQPRGVRQTGVLGI